MLPPFFPDVMHKKAVKPPEGSIAAASGMDTVSMSGIVHCEYAAGNAWLSLDLPVCRLKIQEEAVHLNIPLS